MHKRSVGHKTVLFNYLKNYFKKGLVDFHGGPMVKTFFFQCEGCGFNPWLGS